MNTVSISGRLIREPEFRSLADNKGFTTIFIANDYHYGQNKKSSFFKVQAWGHLAKIISEHTHTGSELFITGRLDQSRYEDDKGKTVYENFIVAEQFNFGSRPVSQRLESERDPELVDSLN